MQNQSPSFAHAYLAGHFLICSGIRVPGSSSHALPRNLILSTHRDVHTFTHRTWSCYLENYLAEPGIKTISGRQLQTVWEGLMQGQRTCSYWTGPALSPRDGPAAWIHRCCRLYCSACWEKKSMDRWAAHRLQEQWLYAMSHGTAGTKGREVSGDLELSRILPLDALPSCKTILTLSSNEIFKKSQQ